MQALSGSLGQQPGPAGSGEWLPIAVPHSLTAELRALGMKTPQLDDPLDKKHTLGLGSGRAAAVTPYPECEEEQTRQLHSIDSRATRANGWFGFGVLR